MTSLETDMETTPPMVEEANRLVDYMLKDIRGSLAGDLLAFKDMDKDRNSDGSPRAYCAALVHFDFIAKRIIESAVARYRLRGDLQESRAILREVELWRPTVDEGIRCIEAGIRGEVPWDRTKAPQGTLLFALCASALLGDRAGIEWLGERRRSPAFDSDAQAYTEMDDLVRQLLHIHAGGAYDEVVFKFRRKAPKGEWDVGYRELPALIAKRDWAGFATQRAECERRFPLRARSRRDVGVNFYGYGRMGQMTSIDVLGTVMCRFAHWCGYDAGVDGTFYPRAFYAE